MPELSELIEVKHLKKYFDTKHGTLHAVDDVSFSIAKGETLGVVGESGCGKSTLGRMLVHLHSSTDGQILYNGKDITHLKKKELSEYRWRTPSENWNWPCAGNESGIYCL